MTSAPQLRDAQIGPRGTLELLSQREVDALTDPEKPEALYELFRSCALAVLNTGSESDDAAEIFETYKSFAIEIVGRTRGLKLNIRNAPESAFVAVSYTHLTLPTTPYV